MRPRIVLRGSRALAHGARGPRCVLERGHDDCHKYLCAGEFCSGYAWAASDLPHPPSCTTGS